MTRRYLSYRQIAELNGADTVDQGLLSEREDCKSDIIVSITAGAAERAGGCCAKSYTLTSVPLRSGDESSRTAPGVPIAVTMIHLPPRLLGSFPLVFESCGILALPGREFASSSNFKTMPTAFLSPMTFEWRFAMYLTYLKML